MKVVLYADILKSAGLLKVQIDRIQPVFTREYKLQKYFYFIFKIFTGTIQ